MIVDVITSVKDGEDYILQAIQSVQKQTFKNWIYYIIDDGSTDKTKTIIEEQALKDNRIRLISQKSSGASTALNKALKLGVGQFVSFIDADDLWDSFKLEKQLKVFSQGKSQNFCFTMVEEFDEVSNIGLHSYRARKIPLKGYIRSSLLFKRTVIDVIGYFDESVAMGDFIDWMSTSIHQKENLYVLDEVLTYRRVHGNNMTAFANKNDYLKVLKKHLDRRK
jgi:glycosyltransferase involved in cell wall biosynthesis